MKLYTYLKHRKRKPNVPSLLLCQAAENVLLDVTHQNVRRGCSAISHDMRCYLSISYPHGPLWREWQWGYGFVRADQSAGWQGIINTGPRPGDSGSWHFNLGEQVNYLKVFLFPPKWLIAVGFFLSFFFSKVWESLAVTVRERSVMVTHPIIHPVLLI